MRGYAVKAIPIDRDQAFNKTGVCEYTRHYVTMAIDEAVADLKRIVRDDGYDGPIGFVIKPVLFDPVIHASLYSDRKVM